VQVLLEHRRPASVTSPTGVSGRHGERVELATLAGLDPGDVGMRTVVIVGSSGTSRVGDWLVTARELAVPG